MIQNVRDNFTFNKESEPIQYGSISTLGSDTKSLELGTTRIQTEGSELKKAELWSRGSPITDDTLKKFNYAASTLHFVQV
jgi:hypothetical protein